MKLYDRLLHSTGELNPLGKQALHQSPLLLLDNVAEYVAEHNSAGINPLIDTPNVAPPL